jgi:hypothetical protein
MWRAAIFVGFAGSLPLAAAEDAAGGAGSPEDGVLDDAAAGGGEGAAGAADGVAAAVVATLADSEAPFAGGGLALPHAARSKASEANEAGKAANKTRMDDALYFLISISSTSNVSVEFGGMTLPMP